MSLFNGTAYEKWRRGDNHGHGDDVDSCHACHESGNHEDAMLLWRDKCDSCAVEVNKKSANVVLELVFKPEDIDLALFWAKRKGHDYSGERVEHLLHDAMLDGAIEPSKWAAL